MSNVEFSKYKKERKKIKKKYFKTKTLSKRKIAIIVPFREQIQQKRGKMLIAFLKYMPNFLKNLNYKIYIIEQSDDNKKFNRGKLLNIGMKIAIKDKCEILISHDVDLLPHPNMKPYYANYSTNPIHIGDRWKDKYSFSTFIGGVLTLSPKLVKSTNGYPNDFWGWGGEDDALYNRLSKNVSQICCPIEGDIKEIYHFNTQEKKQLTNLKKRENILKDLQDWKTNGMSNLKYKLLNKSGYKYTVKI
jgi:hypothetical protein